MVGIGGGEKMERMWDEKGKRKKEKWRKLSTHIHN